MPAFQGLHLLAAAGRPSAPKGNGGYGPLFPTPDLRDGVSRISLPEGFSYRSFSLAGTMMSDGNQVPLAHDGMGVFNMANGKFRLVRNHEDRERAGRRLGGNRPGQVVRHQRRRRHDRPSRSTRSPASSNATGSP